MPAIRIEPDAQVKRDRCDTCGGEIALTLGLVYADDDAHGIYYLEWCEGAHAPRTAFLTVSLGEYGDEDAGGADRLAFCIESRCDGMRLCDTPVRDRPDFLGRFVPRDEALAWPDLSHLWHVADHIATDDPRMVAVAGWLCGERDSALAGR